MPDQVKVEDFEAFRTFRAALLKFAQAADLALANADSQVARAQQWLESEQTTYWQSQFRKRSEMAVKAREAVRQKKIYKDSSGRTPGAVEEEKFLAKCAAAVAEAEQKIQAVKRWLPKLEKARDAYRGGVAGINRDVGGEIPKAVALLDRLSQSLEEYSQIEVPETPAVDISAPAENTMARPADETPAPPPAETPKTEDTPDVPDRK
jgi:hypothetical protein